MEKLAPWLWIAAVLTPIVGIGVICLQGMARREARLRVEERLKELAPRK